MSADIKKFKIFSLIIILLDVAQQVLGWIFIIGIYIYKTPSCTFYFYSGQCCPETDDYNDSLTCSQAKQIQYQFIGVIISPLAIYLLFTSLFMLSYFLCSSKKHLALRFGWFFMLMCTFGSKTIFFMLFAEIPILARKTQDEDILVIRDICVELLIQLFLKLFLLLGICCEVNDSEFWQKHESVMLVLKPIVMQTVLIDTNDHPFYDKISQVQSIQSKQWQRNQQYPTDGSIIHEQLDQKKQSNKQLDQIVEQQQPILGWPVEGQAINK